MTFSVAIDGPAGAGKSTIAKKIAAQLQCVYIDTGAMYRTVGLYCITNNIDYTIEEKVNEAIPSIEITLAYQEGTQSIYMNGQDVSQAIRTQEVAAAASKVATFGKVREYLVTLQRQFAQKQSIVMDGRDIGTVVLPQATVKVFLTASAKERAKRRFLELEEKGQKVDFQSLVDEINARDLQDSTRKESPLCQADDAICIDSTSMGIDEVVTMICELLEGRMTNEC